VRGHLAQEDLARAARLARLDGDDIDLALLVGRKLL